MHSASPARATASVTSWPMASKTNFGAKIDHTCVYTHVRAETKCEWIRYEIPQACTRFNDSMLLQSSGDPTHIGAGEQLCGEARSCRFTGRGVPSRAAVDRGDGGSSASGLDRALRG
eukprot:2192431-Pyramimonas_sp.AAC.1